MNKDKVVAHPSKPIEKEISKNKEKTANLKRLEMAEVDMEGSTSNGKFVAVHTTAKIRKTTLGR